MTLDLIKLNKFIINAHIQGYASSGEGAERALPNKRKELVYREDSFLMRDQYFGSKNFIGE